MQSIIANNIYYYKKFYYFSAKFQQSKYISRRKTFSKSSRPSNLIKIRFRHHLILQLFRMSNLSKQLSLTVARIVKISINFATVNFLDAGRPYFFRIFHNTMKKGAKYRTRAWKWKWYFFRRKLYYIILTHLSITVL